VLPFYLNATTLQQKKKISEQGIVFQSEDKEILERLFYAFKDDKNTPISDLIVKVGTFFKETPYRAATLEINSDEEKLVINLREMDCTTFAENVLAISRTIKNGNPTFEKFAEELQNIRYRDGKIDGYSSRNHYFSDWIFENDRGKTIQSVSKEIGGTLYPKIINFMSTHPDSYLQLKNHPGMIKTIADREKEISTRETYFIPKEKIGDFESKLKEGDIVGITSRVDGLDVSHVGILIRKDGRIHLMHASTVSKKVIVSEETLEEYLLKSKSVTGIMVARPI
jgi:hypothetical protein